MRGGIGLGAGHVVVSDPFEPLPLPPPLPVLLSCCELLESRVQPYGIASAATPIVLAIAHDTPLIGTSCGFRETLQVHGMRHGLSESIQRNARGQCDATARSA